MDRAALFSSYEVSDVSVNTAFTLGAGVCEQPLKGRAWSR